MICDLAAYRRITRDGNSFDGDVLAALVDAQKFVEEKTERFFESATRTEKLRQYPDNRVYPSATPISSVSVPAGSVVEGNSVRASAWQYNDAVINWYLTDSSFEDSIVEITYIGGYAPGNIPVDIVKVTADIAKLALMPSPIQVPVGATSVTVGDVSITGLNLELSELPTNIKRTLRTWRKRSG